MIRIDKTIFGPIFVLLLITAGAVASPRDLTITPPPDAPLPYVVQVVSPQAHCAAISDTLGLIAIGNRMVGGKAGEVTIFGLDAQGKIVGQPVPAAPPPPPAKPGAPAVAPTPPPPPKPLFTITLPRPASLNAFGNGAISIVFHPKLPLLYIWQDTTGPAFINATVNPVIQEFDHLLIYSVSATAPPQLLQSVGRGQEYFYGQTAGSIALDPAATRLFVPNLRLPEAPVNLAIASVGYLKLDAQGLPARAGDKPDLTIDAVQGYNQYPVGLGFVPVSDDVTLTCAMVGPVTWDRSNRRGRWLHFQMTPLAYNSYRIVAHPTLPVVYLSMINTACIFRMEQADGFLTLLPQMVSIIYGIYSPPVVMTRQKKVAVGGASRVHVVSIDDEGYFTPHMEQMTVSSTSVEALVYSEKFDRLYVPVEQLTP